MGRSAITTISIGCVFLTCTLYLAPDAPSQFRRFFKAIGVPEHQLKSILTFLRLTEGDDQSPVDEKEIPQLSELLLTPEELKKYDGGPKSEGLYLAILGEVFDVQKGAQHYKPGGGYAFFAGRDATRAYITGDFSENGLTDDITGLKPATLMAIEDWLSLYREEYIPVGKLIGRFYDQNGSPTQELLSVREKLSKSQENKWLEDNDKEIFPPCNSEWSKEKGSKVWCTKKSGGVSRDWVGVPRELHQKGKDPRCVCVRNYGPPTGINSVHHSDHGDLNHPDLKEYPECPPASESCNVSHP